VSTKPSLLDTTVFIAAAFPREKHHREGSAIIASVEEGALGEPVITDYILDEVVTFVRKKVDAAASIEMLDAMINSVMRDLGIEVIYSFDSDFDGIPGIVRLTTV